MLSRQQTVIFAAGTRSSYYSYLTGKSSKKCSWLEIPDKNSAGANIIAADA